MFSGRCQIILHLERTAASIKCMAALAEQWLCAPDRMFKETWWTVATCSCSNIHSKTLQQGYLSTLKYIFTVSNFLRLVLSHRHSHSSAKKWCRAEWRDTKGVNSTTTCRAGVGYSAALSGVLPTHLPITFSQQFLLVSLLSKGKPKGWRQTNWS